MTWSSVLKALAVVVLRASAVIAPYAVGVHNGAASEKARCLKAASAEDTEAITALQAELQLAWKQLRDQQQQATAEQAKQLALEQQLATARAQTRVVYRSIRQEIAHASSTVSAPAPSELAVSADPSGGAGGDRGAAAADCVFGGAFVRLWDAASDPGRAAADGGEPAGTAGLAAAPAGAADPAPPVSAEQLLANHVDNAELCTEARADLNALIDWHLGRQADPPRSSGAQAPPPPAPAPTLPGTVSPAEHDVKGLVP